MNIYFLSQLYPVGYDEFEAKVIVASSAKEARKLANIKTGDEGKIWNNSKKVSCVLIDLSKTGVILEAFKAG